MATGGQKLLFSSTIFVSPRQRTVAKETPFIFFRGENTLKLDWPLKSLLHDKGPLWELLAAPFSRGLLSTCRLNFFSAHALIVLENSSMKFHMVNTP